MLKVKDVMTKDVISVKKETPIYEAMEIMRKKESWSELSADRI